MPIYEYRCETDDLMILELRAIGERNDPVSCPTCCEPMQRLLPRVIHTTSWGGPRYVASFDRTFDSRSELEQYKKACHVEDAGDRVGGARNEERRKHNTYFSSAERR